MKFEEVLGAFREGKRVRRKSNGFWINKSNSLMVGQLDILADDWEVERERIKYWVELWGNEFGFTPKLTLLCEYLFGGNCKYNSQMKSASCPTKYRITIEEIDE